MEPDLLAAIAADPGDEDAKLVYADWLIARGDRRGDLIALDHRERTTPGGLTDPDALAQLLRFGAQYGFPALPDPDAGLVEIRQLAVGRYELAHGDEVVLLEGRWSDKETNVVLNVASASLRAGRPFHASFVPSGDELRAHPAYRLGPWPRYFSAKVYEDFGEEWLLRARDYDRWHALYDRLVPLIR